MNKIKVAMAVMAVVMALSVSAVAFAQTPTPPQPPQPSAYNQTFWQTLADKLGTSVEKVQQAVRDVLKAVVGQALKNGKLTETQADDANTRIDKQVFDKPMFGAVLGQGRPWDGTRRDGTRRVCRWQCRDGCRRCQVGHDNDSRADDGIAPRANRWPTWRRKRTSAPKSTPRRPSSPLPPPKLTKRSRTAS